MQPYAANNFIKQFIRLTPDGVLESSFTELELVEETDSHLVFEDFKLDKLDTYKLLVQHDTLDNKKDCISVSRYIKDLDPSDDAYEHDFEFYHHVTIGVLAKIPSFKDLAINSDGDLVTKKSCTTF